MNVTLFVSTNDYYSYAIGELRFSSIAVVIYNGIVRSAGVYYGKKYALLGLRKDHKILLPFTPPLRANFDNSGTIWKADSP